MKPVPAMFPDSLGRTLRITAEPPRMGGSAAVYQGVLEGRFVAVKIYHTAFHMAEPERRMLEEILEDDPKAGEWLITVLASGTVEGRPFTVLPWMHSSLGDWFPGRPLAERVAALIGATESVARLHLSRRDLAGYRVHRDIKPDNFLVAFEGGRWVVRLADLGTAKQGNSLAHTTNTLGMTPNYAPPEQALPTNQEPGESWDVHALGVTIFEVLTGKLPGPAHEAQTLLSREGIDLTRKLHSRWRHGALTEAERSRYDALRSRPPEALLDLDAATGWGEQDDEHLRRELVDGAEVMSIPPATREGLLTQLTVALKAALEADRRKRDNDVRRLLFALRGLAASLPGVAGRGSNALPVAPPPTRAPSVVAPPHAGAGGSRSVEAPPGPAAPARQEAPAQGAVSISTRTWAPEPAGAVVPGTVGAWLEEEGGLDEASQPPVRDGTIVPAVGAEIPVPVEESRMERSVRAAEVWRTAKLAQARSQGANEAAGGPNPALPEQANPAPRPRALNRVVPSPVPRRSPAGGSGGDPRRGAPPDAREPDASPSWRSLGVGIVGGLMMLCLAALGCAGLLYSGAGSTPDPAPVTGNPFESAPSDEPVGPPPKLDEPPEPAPAPPKESVAPRRAGGGPADPSDPAVSGAGRVPSVAAPADPEPASSVRPTPTQPAPTPIPPDVTLTVISCPVDATVLIDGHPEPGGQMRRRQVSPSPHTVVWKHPGEPSHSVEVDLSGISASSSIGLQTCYRFPSVVDDGCGCPPP